MERFTQSNRFFAEALRKLRRASADQEKMLEGGADFWTGEAGERIAEAEAYIATQAEVERELLGLAGDVKRLRRMLARKIAQAKGIVTAVAVAAILVAGMGGLFCV